MGARRNFSRGGTNSEDSERLNGISVYSVYLWNTNTCCRISLCGKETDGVPVSDSVQKTEKQNPGGASAPPCTFLRAPLLSPYICSGVTKGQRRRRPRAQPKRGA